jgi:DNA relaxase NicK
METTLDWLSFSIILGESHPDHGWNWTDVQRAVEHLLGDTMTEYISGDGWEPAGGRKPYAQSFRNVMKGITVFWSGKMFHALIEISGVGMKAIRDAGLQEELLQRTQARATRIDIATDIQTDVLPLEFATQRNVARFKAHGSYTSKSGYTEYIGSRTGELFARVYRYSDPHPRSAFLRVEHECKGQTAKATIALLLAHGVAEVQAGLGARFGWCHPLWQPDQQRVLAITTPANRRQDAKTEIWLRTQVAASFRRLVASGTIGDARAWVEEVLLS